MCCRSASYFQAVRDLCDKYDILLILDEVNDNTRPVAKLIAALLQDHVWHRKYWYDACVGTGGNLGTRHSDHWESLGGWLCATVGRSMRGRIFDALGAGSSGLLHGHTFWA